MILVGVFELSQGFVVVVICVVVVYLRWAGAFVLLQEIIWFVVDHYF